MAVFGCDSVACYRPIDAYKANGEISFNPKSGGNHLHLPCGRCIGCRISQRQDWTVRLMHEALMHEHTCFITLTYSRDPVGLQYGDFQYFMRKVRRRYGECRFFCAGEYGSLGMRPHWHAAFYGLDFTQMDARVIKSGQSFKLYESEALNSLWKHGFASVGSLTPQSAAYIAKYCTKKIGVDQEPLMDVFNLDTGEIYERRSEFVRMSLKPGIGSMWYDKYSEDAHSLDRCRLLDGSMNAVPRFYMKKLEAADPKRYADTVLKRFSKRCAEDNTWQRLAAREKFAELEVDFFNNRSL